MVSQAIEADNKSQTQAQKGRPPAGKGKPKRLTLQLSRTAASNLDLLVDEMDMNSYADVIRESLAALHYFWDMHKHGNQIVIRDRTGDEKSVELFALKTGV